MGALLAIASGVAVLVPAARPPALMVEVLNGAVTASGHVDGSSRGTTLQFSDGTRLELAEEARARVGAITARGAELELEKGKVSVHVVPLPESRWALRAGAHRVNVTGTAFDLEFDPADQSLSLDLEKGSVTVSGPLIDGELKLKAGERLQVRPSDGGVRVSARAERAVAPSEAPGAPESEPSADVEALPEIAARDIARANGERKSPEPAVKDSWRQRVATGRFEEIIALAQQRGLTRVYEQADLEELEALADAARYSRRNDVALPALKALRSRFASSRAARDAAFFLGRIEEDRGSPASALEHYGQYLRENENGAHASHALGRMLVIVVAREGAKGAQPLAHEYLKRFPNGPHSAIARDVAQKTTRSAR